MKISRPVDKSALYTALAHALVAQSREHALSVIIKDLLADYLTAAVWLLYEADAANQQLIPTFTLNQSRDFRTPRLAQFSIMDLDNPVSLAYVTGTFPAAAPLHSYVSRSTGFTNLKNQIASNPVLHICPLSLPGGQKRHGVLLAVDFHGDDLRDRPDWRACLGLFTAMIAKLRFERDQSDRQAGLQRELQSRDAHEHERSRLAEIGKRYIGSHKTVAAVQQAISRAADNDLTVLIQGETGTGKDLIALLIHQLSARSAKRFVAVNCAALPAELIEAEIFGAKRGAYTGSVADRVGLAESAEGGVLFLDEIGDMPYRLQAVLLRLLNEGSYRRVGDTQERKADFRIICATNAPLIDMIERGEFRRDLYYRICQTRITAPSLKDRLDDIGELAAHFAANYALEGNDYRPPPSAAQTAVLAQHHWPGNVRELKHFLLGYFAQQTPAQAGDERPLQQYLAEWRAQGERVERIDDASPFPLELWRSADLRRANDLFERQMIENRLRRYQGNRSRTADSLGIPKRTLAYKCKKLNIDIQRVAAP